MACGREGVGDGRLDPLLGRPSPLGLVGGLFRRSKAEAIDNSLFV